MTFNLNYVRNLNDGSGILSTGVTYANIYDLSAGLLLILHGPGKHGIHFFPDKIRCSADVRNIFLDLLAGSRC